jgi:hypothetical protein
VEKLKPIINRLKEPSSWAGITAMAGMFGVSLDPGIAQNIAFIGAGICGILAVLMPEKAVNQGAVK